MTFKSFSQTDTLRAPVVTLTEKQAKQVIKDLIQYDNLKLITAKLEDRISLFERKEFRSEHRDEKHTMMLSDGENNHDLRNLSESGGIRWNPYESVADSKKYLT